MDSRVILRVDWDHVMAPTVGVHVLGLTRDVATNIMVTVP